MQRQGNVLTRGRLLVCALAVVMIGSVACAPIPSSNPTPTFATTPLPMPEITGTLAEPPSTPVATPTLSPTATAITPATATPESTPTATVYLPTNVPPINGNTDNIWAVVLGEAGAASELTVRPCEGDGPFLCVSQGQEETGAVQLSTYPVETMPDFQRMLTDAGVPAGPANLAEPDNMTKVMAALESFVEAYHASIEGDRQGEYGGKTRYVRLETERMTVGTVPAVRYGFAGINEDESVFERWVSYAAFDGDLLHIVVASYRPGAIPTFRSDEALTQFLPQLTEIVSTLRLPLPVSDTAVASVRALRPLDIFRVYGGELGNPVGQIAAGQTVPVTGVSPTGRHWRIECPDPVDRSCWIAGTSEATEPGAR